MLHFFVFDWDPFFAFFGPQKRVFFASFFSGSKNFKKKFVRTELQNSPNRGGPMVESVKVDFFWLWNQKNFKRSKTELNFPAPIYGHFEKFWKLSAGKSFDKISKNTTLFQGETGILTTFWLKKHQKTPKIATFGPRYRYAQKRPKTAFFRVFRPTIPPQMDFFVIFRKKRLFLVFFRKFWKDRKRPIFWKKKGSKSTFFQTQKTRKLKIRGQQSKNKIFKKKSGKNLVSKK